MVTLRNESRELKIIATGYWKDFNEEGDVFLNNGINLKINCKEKATGEEIFKQNQYTVLNFQINELITDMKLNSKGVHNRMFSIDFISKRIDDENIKVHFNLPDSQPFETTLSNKEYQDLVEMFSDILKSYPIRMTDYHDQIELKEVKKHFNFLKARNYKIKKVVNKEQFTLIYYKKTRVFEISYHKNDLCKYEFSIVVKENGETYNIKDRTIDNNLEIFNAYADDFRSLTTNARVAMAIYINYLFQSLVIKEKDEENELFYYKPNRTDIVKYIM